MLLLVLFATGCDTSIENQERSKAFSFLADLEIEGPSIDYANSYAELAEKSVAQYRDQQRDYKKLLQEGDYDPFGDFLNWGRDKNYVNVPKDPNGIITSEGEQESYNPCTIAQYSLTIYGQYLQGNATKQAFLHQTDFLLSLIESDGSVRYYFDYPYYCNPDEYFRSGWVSAMDSGHILSICARAYHLTGDVKYVNAAERVLSFLSKSVAEDGVKSSLTYLDPSLADYITFEEYPTIPATYTLNGFMYTLIVLYEWSCVDSPSQEKAFELFVEGTKSLLILLPYYDIGGFTAYDLSHITMNRTTPHIGVGYHVEHTAFCKIFYDITGVKRFNDYYKKWSSYVD